MAFNPNIERLQGLSSAPEQGGLDETERLKLSRSVKIGNPSSDTLILIGSQVSQPLLLSGLGKDVATILGAGATFSDLKHRVAECRPAISITRLDHDLRRFIGRLSSLALLDRGPGAPPSVSRAPTRSKRNLLELPDPDAPARLLAIPLRAISARQRLLLFATVLLLSFYVILTAGYQAGLVPTLSLATVPWAVMALVAVPGWLLMHEFAHAVACRLAGCPVSGASLVVGKNHVPLPQVDTRAMLFIEDKWPRMRCLLAGPFCDLLCLAGIAMAVLAYSESQALGQTLRYLFVYVLLGLLLNTSPRRDSDVSRALAIYFDDPLIRECALRRTRSSLSGQDKLRRYRTFVGVHLVTVLAVTLVLARPLAAGLT